MDYEMSDFVRELNLSNKLNEYYKLFLKGIAGTLNLSDAKTLFHYTDTSKKYSNKDFHFYCIVKGHLHPKFPNIIPSYTEQDKQHFKAILSQSKNFFSLYDLKLIGDVAGHFLQYPEYKQLVSSLNFSPFDFGEDTQLYRTQIHKIYNNFCDIAIFEGDLPIAKAMLKKHKEFASIHPELRYSFYIKLNEITIEFKQTSDFKLLDDILFLIESLNFIGEKNTANVFRYQHDILHKGNEYNPLNSVSFD